MRWILLLFPVIMFGQVKVKQVKYNADIKIYIVKHKNLADRIILDREWVVTGSAVYADTTFSVVKYRNLADKVVYLDKNLLTSVKKRASLQIFY